MSEADEAIKTACAEPTLIDALSWIAIWETHRVVRQAFENNSTGARNPDGSLYDTCFKNLFARVIEAYAYETH